MATVSKGYFKAVIGAFLTLVVCFVPASVAQEPIEYQVKALQLYHFMRFVEWPEEKEKQPTIKVALLCDEAYVKSFDLIKDKTIKGKKIELIRVEDPEKIPDCHVAFISCKEEKQVESVLKSLQYESTLTVGDSKDFCKKGGVIGFINKPADEEAAYNPFVIKKYIVRFEINNKSAKQSGIRIRAKLLSLAEKTYN